MTELYATYKTVRLPLAAVPDRFPLPPEERAARVQAHFSAASSSSPPPPTTGLLKWAPPGWNGGAPLLASSFPGYTVVNLPQTHGQLNLQDINTDYYLIWGHPQWSSNPNITNPMSHTALVINGGRNVVVIGGEMTCTSTNTADDIRCIVFTGGNPAGIKHIEGIRFNKTVNAITINSPGTFRFQNCRFSANYIFQDDFLTGNGFPSTGAHADIIQTWGGGPTIQMHRVTGYSDFTGLTILEGTNPVKWESHDVDIHAMPPQPNSITPTLPLRMGNNKYFGFEHVTVHESTNCWFETGWWSASSRRNLYEGFSYETGSGTEEGFELHPGPGLSGTVYTSPDPLPDGFNPTFSPADLGKRQGDFITWARAALLVNEKWSFGVPTVADGADANGNFVPAALAGAGYVPPGYQ